MIRAARATSMRVASNPPSALRSLRVCGARRGLLPMLPRLIQALACALGGRPLAPFDRLDNGREVRIIEELNQYVSSATCLRLNGHPRA